MNGYDKRFDYYPRLPNVWVLYYRDVLNRFIPRPGSVLDFGCGHGSLPLNGVDTSGLVVHGLDRDANNKFALYHDKDDVEDVYDVILFCHVIEHVTLDSMSELLKWASMHGRRILITVPYTDNPHMLHEFYKDITHIRPLDGYDFAHYIECNDLKIEGFYRSDLDVSFRSIRCLQASLLRTGLEWLKGYSPFRNYTFICRGMVS